MSSIFDWSLTAATNATADSAINWQEGQLPSTVNNSARQMMARVAELLKDVGLNITAGGTANALTITTNSPFTAYATGQIAVFKAASTNTGATTINANSIGAKSVRKDGDADLEGGELSANHYYGVIYSTALNGGSGGWLLINPTSTEGLGQCRLTLSGGSLLLSRFNGSRLTINGFAETIPSAGITLAATGLTPATLYYIYAYMNSGTMTLESSTTAYAVDSATGVQIKSGDATRTLVGMAYPETGPVFTDTAKKRFVRSWYNDTGVNLINNFTANRATSSPHTTPQEVNTEIRCQFLLWAGERAKATTAGSFVNGNASGGQTTAIGFNTTSSPEIYGAIASVAASEVIPFSCTVIKEGLSEGLNFATLMGWVSASGGATFYGDADGRRTVLSVDVRR